MYHIRKTNDPILRKFSDGRTNRQTNERTGQSDFKESCSTNIECPKIQKTYFQSILGLYRPKLGKKEFCQHYLTLSVLRTYEPVRAYQNITKYRKIVSRRGIIHLARRQNFRKN